MRAVQRTRPLRVIQWATGSIGQIAIRHMAENPAFQVVGCYVTSQEKDGRDIGEIAGTGPLGVAAARDAGALLALDADCVNYAPLYVDIDEIVRILRSRVTRHPNAPGPAGAPAAPPPPPGALASQDEHRRSSGPPASSNRLGGLR
jgi:hypothetical protein